MKRTASEAVAIPLSVGKLLEMKLLRSLMPLTTG